MNKPTFLARIVSLVSGQRTPTNWFLIDKASYLAYRANMFTEHGELVPMISDVVEGAKKGTLFLDGDGNISAVHETSQLEKLNHEDAIVSAFVADRPYAKEDFVIEGGTVYVKTAAGAVQTFDANQWIAIETGDLVTELSYDSKFDDSKTQLNEVDAVVIGLNDDNIRSELKQPDIIEYIDPDVLAFSIDTVTTPEGALDLSLPADSASSFSVNANNELVFSSTEELHPDNELLVDDNHFLILRTT